MVSSVRSTIRAGIRRWQLSSPPMLIMVSPLLPSRPLVARVFFNWPSMRLKVRTEADGNLVVDLPGDGRLHGDHLHLAIGAVGTAHEAVFVIVDGHRRARRCPGRK